MKNLRLLTLLVACCMFSLTSLAQTFNDYGTYSGTMSDGKTIVVELNANGTATLMIDGNSDNVIEFKYNPAYSSIIKFKALPNAITIGETVATPIFRKGLMEPTANAKEYRLQLGDYGQAAPTQFNSDEIILSFQKDQ